jgi:selT/selW/selH-like putative selenoprotein
MEFLSNPVSKSILTIFLLCMGMDIVSRVFLAPTKTDPIDPAVQAAKGLNVEGSSAYTNATVAEWNQKNEDFYLQDSVRRAAQSLQPVEVRLCTSCGYANRVEEIRKYVQKHFPEVQFVVHNYPVPPIKVVLGYAVRAIQFSIGAVLMFGDAIFAKLGITPPPLYYRLIEKKMMVIMLVVFLGNTVAASLQSSGAFEIWYGGQLIHSKLSTGEYPTGEFIVHRLYELTVPGVTQ